MLFHDLPLFIATHQVYERVSRPGSDEWISTRSKATCKLVLQQIVDDEAWTIEGIPWGPERVLQAWRQIRKQKKLRLLCRVARTHGARCFYEHRGIGPCSPDIDLDRIIPANRGGAYTLKNCVICCSLHNRSRGDLPIEEFLWRGWEIEERAAYEIRQGNGVKAV